MENVSSPSGLFSLKWKGYGGHLTKGISNLLEDEDLADVTLACEGNYIRAHKLLLSLCSPYFKKLFQVHSLEKSNTIVILNHVRFTDLQNVLHFIYTGQVNVSQADLSSFLQTGELLQIEGLASCSETADENAESSPAVGSKAAGSVPTASGRSAADSPSVSDRLKRVINPTPTSASACFGEKRFKSATGTTERLQGAQRRKCSPITLRSVSSDKPEQPLIQIRPESELVEDIDPLDDSNISSYSDHKSAPEDVDSCETEVNFDVLKAEGVEVIDIDDKDDNQILDHGNGESVLAEYLDDGELSQQQEFFGAVTATVADESIFDESAQSRRVSNSSRIGGSKGGVADLRPDSKDENATAPDSVESHQVKMEVKTEEDEVILDTLGGISDISPSHIQRRHSTRQQAASSSTAGQFSLQMKSSISVSGGVQQQSVRDQSSTNEMMEIVTCTSCHVSVPKYSFMEHMLSHSSGGDGQFMELRAVCPFCGKSFKNKNSLKVHKSIYHRNDSVRHQVNYRPSGSYSFQCDSSSQIHEGPPPI